MYKRDNFRKRVVILTFFQKKFFGQSRESKMEKLEKKSGGSVILSE